jgi:hypothetical protein
MKKLVVALFLVAAALGFFNLPAKADGPQAAPALSSADRAFLTSLAAPQQPELAAKKPGGGGGATKSLCSAEANCALGGTISCQGNNSCYAQDGNCNWGVTGYVICDGQYYGCGGSCCPEGFCTRDWQCAQSCYPCNYNYSCNWGGCYDDCQCEYSTCPV